MNHPSTGDPQEGRRFASGCAVVLIGVGILLFAFIAGAFSTWRQYQQNPEEFEKSLKEEYRTMERMAEEKEQQKHTD